MAIIAPFSIPGGLAGLARGLEDGWPAVEQRANHVLDLMVTAPRQRTEPAVLLVQLLACVTVLRDNTPEPAPARLPALLLRALAVVLGVEKHAARAALLAGPLSNAEVAKRLGISERTVRRLRAAPPAWPVEPPLAIADRWRARVAPRSAPSEAPLSITDQWKKRVSRGRPPGAAENLYEHANAGVASGTYFSPPLLWALAEVLEVARRDSGLTLGASEIIHNGLRDPEAFIAAGLATGRLELERAGEGGAERILAARARHGLEDVDDPVVASSINEISAEVGVARDSVRRWHDENGPHADAYELNRLNAAAFAVFHGRFKGRK